MQIMKHEVGGICIINVIKEPIPEDLNQGVFVQVN